LPKFKRSIQFFLSWANAEYVLDCHKTKLVECCQHYELWSWKRFYDVWL